MCGSPDLSRRSWKMTPTASLTLDLKSFVLSATFGNLEDVKLYVAFWGKNVFHASRSEAEIM